MTLDESIDSLGATANKIADELVATRAKNLLLVEALYAAKGSMFYAYNGEDCGDHCRNNCPNCCLKIGMDFIDAALKSNAEVPQ